MSLNTILNARFLIFVGLLFVSCGQRPEIRQSLKEEKELVTYFSGLSIDAEALKELNGLSAQQMIDHLEKKHADLVFFPMEDTKLISSKRKEEGYVDAHKFYSDYLVDFQKKQKNPDIRHSGQYVGPYEPFEMQKSDPAKDESKRPYVGKSIILLPNSGESIEFIVQHEYIHYLMGQALRKKVDPKNEKKGSVREEIREQANKIATRFADDNERFDAAFGKKDGSANKQVEVSVALLKSGTPFLTSSVAMMEFKLEEVDVCLIQIQTIAKLGLDKKTQERVLELSRNYINFSVLQAKAFEQNLAQSHKLLNIVYKHFKPLKVEGLPEDFEKASEQFEAFQKKLKNVPELVKAK